MHNNLKKWFISDSSAIFYLYNICCWRKKLFFINNLLFHTSLHYYPKSSISELSLPLSSGGSSVSSIRASWRGTAPLQYKVSIKTMLLIFTRMHIIMLPFIIKPPWIKLLWSILYTAFFSPCSKNHFPMMLTVDERWPDLCNCCQVNKNNYLLVISSESLEQLDSLSDSSEVPYLSASPFIMTESFLTSYMVSW